MRYARENLQKFRRDAKAPPIVSMTSEAWESITKQRVAHTPTKSPGTRLNADGSYRIPRAKWPAGLPAPSDLTKALRSIPRHGLQNGLPIVVPVRDGATTTTYTITLWAKLRNPKPGLLTTAKQWLDRKNLQDETNAVSVGRNRTWKFNPFGAYDRGSSLHAKLRGLNFNLAWESALSDSRSMSTTTTRQESLGVLFVVFLAKFSFDVEMRADIEVERGLIAPLNLGYQTADLATFHLIRWITGGQLNGRHRYSEPGRRSSGQVAARPGGAGVPARGAAAAPTRAPHRSVLY